MASAWGQSKTAITSLCFSTFRSNFKWCQVTPSLSLKTITSNPHSTLSIIPGTDKYRHACGVCDTLMQDIWYIRHLKELGLFNENKASTIGQMLNIIIAHRIAPYHGSRAQKYLGKTANVHIKTKSGGKCVQHHCMKVQCNSTFRKFPGNADRYAVC